MVGGVFVGAVTLIPNAGSDVVRVPSLTLITMPDYAPTFALVGVPVSAPVAVLKLAHAGLF